MYQIQAEKFIYYTKLPKLCIFIFNTKELAKKQIQKYVFKFMEQNFDLNGLMIDWNEFLSVYIQPRNLNFNTILFTFSSHIIAAVNDPNERELEATYNWSVKISNNPFWEDIIEKKSNSDNMLGRVRISFRGCALKEVPIKIPPNSQPGINTLTHINNKSLNFSKNELNGQKYLQERNLENSYDIAHNENPLNSKLFLEDDDEEFPAKNNKFILRKTKSFQNQRYKDFNNQKIPRILASKFLISKKSIQEDNFKLFHSYQPKRITKKVNSNTKEKLISKKLSNSSGKIFPLSSSEVFDTNNLISKKVCLNHTRKRSISLSDIRFGEDFTSSQVEDLGIKRRK